MSFNADNPPNLQATVGSGGRWFLNYILQIWCILGQRFCIPQTQKGKFPPKRRYVSPVGAAVGTGVVSAHNHKDVLEVRADVFGGERERPGLLEHDGDDVVPNMTLPQ